MSLVVMLTEEDFCQLSRPEAIQMYNHILQAIEDAYDAGLAESACQCSCDKTPLNEITH